MKVSSFYITFTTNEHTNDGNYLNLKLHRISVISDLSPLSVNFNTYVLSAHDHQIKKWMTAFKFVAWIGKVREIKYGLYVIQVNIQKSSCLFDLNFVNISITPFHSCLGIPINIFICKLLFTQAACSISKNKYCCAVFCNNLQ